MTILAQRLANVRIMIQAAEQTAGRPADSVTLLAVSKTHPAEDIRALFHAGQADFGENYVQEALQKMDQLEDLPIVWHFIGPVQSNKTADIAERFHWVHSVDRIKIAQRLSNQRDPRMGPLNVCIQVNTSGEASKAGVHFEEVEQLVAAVATLPNLRLRGLMCIPESEVDPVKQRIPFHQLCLCQQQLIQSGYSLDTLSMGMSNDFSAAILEGSTLVRIGTKLFGPRHAKSI